MRDAIVDEVRKARDEYACRFNYDLDAMCADLRHKQELSGAQIVSLPKIPVRITSPNKALPLTLSVGGQIEGNNHIQGEAHDREN